MKLLYRIPEACDALGMGRSKLYELMKAGDIASVKDGTTRLIPAEAIEGYARRLIESQRDTA